MAAGAVGAVREESVKTGVLAQLPGDGRVAGLARRLHRSDPRVFAEGRGAVALDTARGAAQRVDGRMHL